MTKKFFISNPLAITFVTGFHITYEPDDHEIIINDAKGNMISSNMYVEFSEAENCFQNIKEALIGCGYEEIII